MTPEAALAELTAAFGQTYHASDQACRLISDLLSHAMVGISSRYTTRRSFIEIVYAKEMPITAMEPLAITGLAGVGKSQLLQAVGRVLPADDLLAVDSSHGEFPLQSLWHVELSVRQSILPMLTLIAERAGAPQSAGKTVDRVLARLRSLAYRNGVAVLAIDEFQGINQGSNANSLATRLLLMLREIGTTLVYVTNFSLMHRLKSRNQEDRQRLLTKVRVLERDDLDSPDWRALVDSYIRVAPGVFDIDGVRDSARLWCWTAGLPRMLRFLLLAAYQLARSKGEFTVGMSMCEAAYRSESFSVMREDVELLASQAITRQPIPGRGDLNPPYPHGSWAPENAVAAMLEQETQSRTRANLLDCLTPAERAEFKRQSRSSKTEPRKRQRKQGAAGTDDVMHNLASFKETFVAPK
ncbi:AAA family ATPase [Salinisphaera hydrothermalis]|uniref:AAA family ATPase n=1 Tax=Salinisphaera hydrothermalis TaxID=563188 RepID=UPI0033412A8E